jgi:predicted short-subunit dehydrogenase-like oxidoreductase (DUF2520 family)
MDLRQSFVIIGAGNVAFHLGGALANAGFLPLQVVGRSVPGSRDLASLLNCPYTTSIEEISHNASFYVVAVNDDAIAGVLQKFPLTEKLIFHTSGSSGMKIFGNKFDSCGVFYPLQTFSRNRSLDFSSVPVFLISPKASVINEMSQIASKITSRVVEIDEERLMWIHIAAVFACNFPNHMMTIASDILDRKDLPFRILLPLIEETFSRLAEGSPSGNQTGPAVRGDRFIIEKHLKALEDHPDYQKIYTFVSQSIGDYHRKKNQ